MQIKKHITWSMKMKTLRCHQLETWFLEINGLAARWKRKMRLEALKRHSLSQRSKCILNGSWRCPAWFGWMITPQVQISSFFLLGFNSLNFNLVSSDLEAMDLITYRLGGDFAVANLSQSIGRMQCTSSSDPLPVITSYPYNWRAYIITNW